MASGEIRIDDVGTQFLITLKDGSDIVNLAGATVKQIIFHKPDSSLLTKNASLYTDGTDGKLYYTSIDGDLDQEGLWKIQVVVNFTSSAKFHSDIGTFQVYSNL